MLPRIDNIRQMRLKVGITQKTLADMAGVSTSMINQIESGRSQPSYRTAKAIFDALAAMETKSSHTAGDFCSQDIVKLKPGDTLHDAVEKMRQKSISQIPIFSRTKPVGLISEDGIVKHISDTSVTLKKARVVDTSADLKKARIADTMDSIPPIVDFKTPANVLVPLIRYSKCILVSKNGRIIGIITASDALKMME